MVTAWVFVSLFCFIVAFVMFAATMLFYSVIWVCLGILNLVVVIMEARKPQGNASNLENE